MYKWAEDLFPICRSVAGPGNLETLDYIKKIIPNLRFMVLNLEQVFMTGKSRKNGIFMLHGLKMKMEMK